MIHYSTEDIEALDRIAVENGLDIRQMMELAGFFMVSLFEKKNISKKAAIVVACGKGNKGGDGLSAARHLVNHGWKHVSVVFADTNLKPEPAHHRALIETMHIPVHWFSDNGRVAQEAVVGADVVIDALIGYHIVGAPRGAFAELITAIHESAAYTVSYDLPSGADPSTGEGQLCVNADATLSLAVPKKLFETERGKQISGAVYIADIGIPSVFYDAVRPNSRPEFPFSGIIEYPGGNT